MLKSRKRTTIAATISIADDRLFLRRGGSSSKRTVVVVRTLLRAMLFVAAIAQSNSICLRPDENRRAGIDDHDVCCRAIEVLMHDVSFGALPHFDSHRIGRIDIKHRPLLIRERKGLTGCQGYVLSRVALAIPDKEQCTHGQNSPDDFALFHESKYSPDVAGLEALRKG